MQKPGNNTGIIGNFERIIGSFWGNKRIIGDVSSIIYQGLVMSKSLIHNSTIG